MIKSYKGLNIKLNPEGVPILTSPSWGLEWPAGEEAVSSVTSKRELQEPGGKGIYSLKSPREVEKQGYWDRKKWPGILAEITPYGDVAWGKLGYRSEKASISAIVREDYVCDSCSKAIGTVLVSRGKEETPLLLCKTCLAKLEKALPKARLKETSIENFWNTLSQRYGIPITRVEELEEYKRLE